MDVPCCDSWGSRRRVGGLGVSLNKARRNDFLCPAVVMAPCWIEIPILTANGAAVGALIGLLAGGLSRSLLDRAKVPDHLLCFERALSMRVDSASACGAIITSVPDRTSDADPVFWLTLGVHFLGCCQQGAVRPVSESSPRLVTYMG